VVAEEVVVVIRHHLCLRRVFGIWGGGEGFEWKS
jgi:hypothetical protein